ncbi:MAG: hypothetical protein O7A98_02545 [Acidobacteria bacterium]|nr:hypothetical protein [Acidobacteriota bacterium]MCZ6726217.1 hypothetical protein [Acidobacteriota bacterium]
MTHCYLSSVLVLVGATLGCSSNSVPDANRALRPLPLTSAADLAAYEVADAASDQLAAWYADAFELRESGEELPADDPLLDGCGAAAIDRIRLDAVEQAASPELVTVLLALAEAQQERLTALVRPGKFRFKRHLEAERRVAELRFGLRRWRLQR